MTTTSSATSVDALRQTLLGGTSRQFEQLAADLLSAFIGVTFYVARAGFQHGADAGTSGLADQHLRVECKRYLDTTSLSDRELRGEIDDALEQNPNLDAWILASTRGINETTRNALHKKSEDVGLPIVVLDWTPIAGQLPVFAALCAFAPKIVELHYGAMAAQFAKILSVEATSQLSTLKRNLETSYIGYDAIKALADRKIESIWNSEAEAKAQFAQNIAIGVSQGAIERVAVSTNLETWWQKEPNLPAIIIGDEGVGKTWAIVQWVYRKLQDLPVVLLIPSSSFREIHGLNVASVQDFIAGELHTLASSRTREFWRRRVQQILKGPGFLLVVDGLNQDPSFEWARLFEILQGDHFSKGLRIIASSQRHYFEQDLRQLSRLKYQPTKISVTSYDLDAGGELDQMLELHGLRRGDLPPGVIELARNPRMFSLVLRFRKDIDTQGDITVNRLIWAYNRDELWVRPGRAFTDGEWENWLHGLATKLKDADSNPFAATKRERNFSLDELSLQLQLPHRNPEDIYRRLNEIVDGKWMEPVPGSSRSYRPRSEIITLALGLGLVEHLRSTEDSKVEAELSRLLDPIRASSTTADILAAALPIAVSTRAAEAVITGVVTELLQSQNGSDDHRAEVLAIAPLIAGPVLNALERSWTRAHASARLWAITAVRRVPEDNYTAWTQIRSRLQAWMAVTDCPSERERAEKDGSADHRSKALLEKLGTDKPGVVTVFDVSIALRTSDQPYLGNEVPRILQGCKLNKAINIFKAAAISVAIGTFRTDGWVGLKWLVTFDTKNRNETVLAITNEIDALLACPCEVNVQPELRERIAAIMLWLTAEPELEARAKRINPSKYQFFNYETDYLQDPAKSYLSLERRHLDLILADPEPPAQHKFRRIKNFLPDPTFVVPDALQTEVSGLVSEFDLTKTKIGRFYTMEDHDLDEILLLSSRIAPKTLPNIGRRLLRELGSREGEGLLSLCIAAPEHLLVAGPAELEIVRAARPKCESTDENDVRCARMQLLEIEIPHLQAYEQLCSLAEDSKAFLSIRLVSCTSPCMPEEVDRFLAEHDPLDRRAYEALLNHLAQHVVAISDNAFMALAQFIDRSPTHNLHVIALMALANCAPNRLGGRLLDRGWKFSDDQTVLEMDCGSKALVAACTDKPLLDLQNLVAPWRLLEEARRRGDSMSLKASAQAISELILPERWKGSEAPVVLSVDTDGQTGRISISELEDGDTDIVESLNQKRQRERWQETQDRGKEYLDSTRRHGALLYSVSFRAEDVLPLIMECRSEVDAWLVGSEEKSVEFRARVNLASGFYVALCEALIAVEPERGTALWRCLESLLPIRHVGTAEISEMIHILFRALESPQVNALRDEFFSIRRLHNEIDFFELVIAAIGGGSKSWLELKIADDENSGAGWRLKRAAMLRGMMERPKLEEMTWPQGEPNNSLEEVKRTAIYRKNTQTLAYFWWEEFLRAKTIDESYVAWTLFLSCADRRCWIWIRELANIYREENSPELWRLKMSHFEANLGDLKNAMKDHEKKGAGQMDRNLWGWENPADLIDMNILEIAN